MAAVPWIVLADGIAVTVRLTPKGGRDAIEGIEILADGRSVLKARVRVAAAEGRANAALERLIARALDVAPSRVDVVAGETARVKKVKVSGDGAILAGALARSLAKAPATTLSLAGANGRPGPKAARNGTS